MLYLLLYRGLELTGFIVKPGSLKSERPEKLLRPKALRKEVALLSHDTSFGLDVRRPSDPRPAAWSSNKLRHHKGRATNHVQQEQGSEE